MKLATGVDGSVSDGFEQVAQEFERNFTERGEVGAAFAAVRDGELVVDLWGGVADRPAERPWAEDTLQLIFSGTKGLVAVCLLIALERGLLELDAPVARYWPAFGKDEILVRDVVSHTARLPGIDTSVTLEQFLDPQHMAALLERQAPSEDPRAGLCYHAFTFGWLCGELLRCVDGRRIGRFFAEEVAEPLELDLWIGLPPGLDARASRLELAADWPTTSALTHAVHERDALLRSIWGNPPTFARETFAWNSGAARAAEIPGVGGLGTARSIARLYGNLGRLLSPETLRLGRTELSNGWDEAHGSARRFGVGFELQTSELSLGPPPEAFGHGGAGGSLHGAWPEQRVGFSYAMNLMRDDETVDARSNALLTALYRCVSG
jgi:CubicO group peptidase (beta-lactamase class C family)